MFGIGGGEFLVIALVALLVFGPSRLPEVARNVAKVYREFNRWRSKLDDTVSELRQEIDLSLDTPENPGLARSKPAADKPADVAAAPTELRRPVTQDVNVPEWDDYLAPPSYEPADDAGADMEPETAAVVAGADDDYLGGGDGR